MWPISPINPDKEPYIHLLKTDEQKQRRSDGIEFKCEFNVTQGMMLKNNAHWLSFDEKKAAKILGQKAADFGEQEYQRQLKYLMLRKSSDKHGCNTGEVTQLHSPS